MGLKNLVVALSTVAVASAFAQASLGTVTTVEGVVSATVGTTGVNVTPGTQVRDGMRFVTTSRGSVTLQMNSGCSVAVPPANGVTVLSSMTCQQLQAAVQPIVPVASQSTGVGAGNVAIAVGGAAIAIGILRSTNDNGAASGGPISAQ
jgi:hypothetical protein